MEFGSAIAYGTKYVPVTIRDSTYVLDELCNNETELPIREHMTDTAGATEIIFALFDLLGYRFTPRLRDLGDRRLFTSGSIDMSGIHASSPRLPTDQSPADFRVVERHGAGHRAYETRLGDSLAVRPKAPGYPQQNALATALQEYGRLVVPSISCAGMPTPRSGGVFCASSTKAKRCTNYRRR